MLFSNRDLKKLLLPLIAEQILMSLMGTADAMMGPTWELPRFPPSHWWTPSTR